MTARVVPRHRIVIVLALAMMSVLSPTVRRRGRVASCNPTSLVIAPAPGIGPVWKHLRLVCLRGQVEVRVLYHNSVGEDGVWTIAMDGLVP